jgi:formylglycine-generating enzyme required for sulfatase activity
MPVTGCLVGLVGVLAMVLAMGVTWWGGGRHSSRDGELPAQFTNSLGMKLVLIPAGSFTMGSPPDEAGHDSDEEQHEVEITQPFYMGVYLVTQEEYVKATKQKNPSYFSSSGGGKAKVAGLDTSRFPVETVSWEDADEFCQVLTRQDKAKPKGWVYRLPTEAEWEYACRAQTQTTYYFGDDPKELAEYAWFAANSEGRPHPVGQKKANRWGLYDMQGNVWEWCQDWYDKDYYQHSRRQDPQGPDKTDRRVLRGGSWNYLGGDCRAADRYRGTPGNRVHNYGFRVVCVPPRTP